MPVFDSEKTRGTRTRGNANAVGGRVGLSERVLAEQISKSVSQRLDERVVFKAMADETRRFMKWRVKEKVFDRKIEFSPSFIAHCFKLFEERSVEIRDGAIASDKSKARNELRTTAMVGGSEGGGVGHVFKATAPLENDYDAFRRTLWKTAERAVALALKSYSEELGKKNKSLETLSKEKRNVHVQQEEGEDFDVSELVQAAKFVGARMLRNEKIVSTSAKVFAGRETRFFLNSEGTRIKTTSNYFAVTIEVVACVNGSNVSFDKQLYFRKRSELTPEKVYEAAEKIAQKISEVENRKQQEPGVYPVLLDPDMHGVLWHEAIGHGLEKHRIDSSEEGGTFGGMKGKKIAPSFLSVCDDPTLEGKWGSYEYDEDGVKAQRVVLVQNGVLKNYLHSRSTAGEEGAKSNGHARAGSGFEGDDKDTSGIPTPRMSNLVVRADEEKAKPIGKLLKQFARICKSKGLKYGLYCVGSEGGEVDTETGQFKFTPKEVYRVYLDGSVERVEDMVIIGTPYQLLSQIVACGSDEGGMRGFCGAESGDVPSEEIAPHALMKSAEFARRENGKPAENLLPPPKTI